MTSQQIQYIIVFVILAAVLAWIVYRLVRKKPDGGIGCSCCPLASNCKKRDVTEKKTHRSTPCDDFPPGNAGTRQDDAGDCTCSSRE